MEPLGKQQQLGGKEDIYFCIEIEKDFSDK